MGYPCRIRLAAIALCCASTALLHDSVAAQPARYEHPPRAERPAREHAEDEPRRLGKHLFMPTQLVLEPFATSYFRSTTGGGHAISRGPGVDVFGQLVGEHEYTQASLNQTFELQVAPLPWLAARASGSAFAYTGFDAVTVLAVGPAAEFGAGGGLTLSLPGASRFRSALLFDVEHGPAEEVSVLDPMIARLMIRTVIDRSVLETHTTTTLRPGMSAAFAPHRALGLLLNAHYVVDVGPATDDPGSDRDAFSLGAALDFDLHALSSVALGIGVAYRMVESWAGAFEPDHEFDLGLFHTGRPEFVLGLVGGFRSLPQIGRADTTAWVGAFTLRYYF